MNNIAKDYPYLAKYLKKNIDIQHKDALETKWHWASLFTFGLLTIASLKYFAILILLITILGAIIKGPLLAIFGAAYAFLVSLFPPLAIVLSIVFFLMNISALTKSWRVSLVTGYFYLYPIIGITLRHFAHLDSWWHTVAFLLPGLLGLHFLLKWTYKRHPLGHQVFWTLFSTPFELFSIILPKRLQDPRGKIVKTPKAAKSRVKMPSFK